MTRIDRNMLVGEALWILGHQDLSDVDTLMRGIFEKAETLDTILVKKSLDEYISLIDSFQVKAEKLDELMSEHEGEVFLKEMVTHQRRQLATLKDKLEAIKTLLKEAESLQIWERDLVKYNNFRENLKGILGAEG